MSNLKAERAVVCITILSPFPIVLPSFAIADHGRGHERRDDNYDYRETSSNGRTNMIYADDSSVPTLGLGLVSSSPILADGLNSSVTGEAAISDAVFKALTKLALSRVEKTPLSKTTTMLLGLSTGDEVIFTKQIGVSAGEDLHGLIVSIKPDTDDIILVNRTNAMMDIYLTDSSRQLRAAAILQRDSDRPNLVTNEHAAAGYARELNTWAMLAEIAKP